MYLQIHVYVIFIQMPVVCVHLHMRVCMQRLCRGILKILDSSLVFIEGLMKLGD